ncbi:MAG: hypothetical protein ACKVOK_10355 [Flavobacteriales bacterium]
MRHAIIDCGTNTFNLLVADTSDSGWNVVFQNKLPVKLGAGGFANHEIMPSRFVRGLDALFCHKHNILNFECHHVHVFATSAIREAGNGSDFVANAKTLFDFDIKVIDGEREAELIYKGVSRTIDLGDKPSLIMDIGGGSTEFIIADRTGVYWKKSFLLGVSRLHERISPSARMSSDEVNTLHDLLDEELKPLKEALDQYEVTRLIGSSGSFDTLFELYVEGTNQKNFVHQLSNEIPLETFPGIHAWLMGSTFEERMKHPVIPAIRAEYMPLASFLVYYVLGMKKFEKLYHSAYSLKEGAMVEFMGQGAGSSAH